MELKKAELENFGKFHQKTFAFSPGINVIYGENESGKSTLHQFLTGMLFGMEKGRSLKGVRLVLGEVPGGAYRHYEPWNAPSYYAGKLEFAVETNPGREAWKQEQPMFGREEKVFALERNFYQKEKKAHLYSKTDREELSIEQGDLEMLLGGVGKEVYENTFCISQAAVVTELDFAGSLQQELSNHMRGGQGDLNVQRAIQNLIQKRKSLEKQQHQEQQKRQKEIERLEWEQERLQEDRKELLQKQKQLSEEESQKNGTGSSEAENDLGTAETKGSGKTKPKPSVWKRLLQLLKCFFCLFTGKKDQKQEETKVPKEPAKAMLQESAAIQLLQEQLEEKTRYLSNISEEIQELREESKTEKELQLQQKSLTLAAEVLKQAALEEYQENQDEIKESVLRIFTAITGGKYDRMEVTEEDRIYLWENEERIETWQLSRGTLEQLYLAIHLGIGRCFTKEEPLPILLDEPFGSYDDLRLYRTLQWLSKQPEQILLFTSQKREWKMLEEMGVEYQKILL